jgi:CDGSH-type Zn-finger protein
VHFLDTWSGSITLDNKERDYMSDVKITVKPNGPYRVEGMVKLVDAEGREWDLSGKPAFSLCRCGASTNKPFCDGTHSKLGFQAAEAAVRKEEAAQGQVPPPNPVTKM